MWHGAFLVMRNKSCFFFCAKWEDKVKCIDETGDDDDDSLVANKIRTSGRLRMEVWLWCGQPTGSRNILVMKKVGQNLPCYIPPGGDDGNDLESDLFAIMFPCCWFCSWSLLFVHLCPVCKRITWQPGGLPISHWFVLLLGDQFVSCACEVINLLLIIASYDQFVICPTEVVNFVLIHIPGLEL